MKTIKYLFGMLLALSCSMQAMAQAIEDGEAFYIYRNDGDFNGFFYDEVLEMRYSKIGIDSLEYDDYMVQEVVTADSIYRIPLCAIDSISFVQPEIVFNPRLKNMDELGMLQYLNPGRWPDKIMFVPFMPRELIPEVGDVLISFDQDAFPEKQGMGGRVNYVDVNDAFICVTFDPLTSLHDLFTRFITVERITAAPDGSQKVRMAGYRQMQEAMTARKKAISYDSDIFKFDGTLSHEYKYGDNMSIAASLDVGIRAGVSVCYDIDIDHIFMKTSLNQSYSLQAGFSATFSGDWEPDLNEKLNKILAVRFPAVCPIFETHPIPNAFFRANGTLELKTTLPKITFKAKELVIFSDRTGSMLNCRFKPELEFLEPNSDFIESCGGTLSLSGFVQAGIVFKADVTTNGWVKDFFHGDIGLTTHIGPKLSGTLECDLAQLASGNIYESVSNSALSFSLCNIDMEASASIFCKGVGSAKEKFGQVNYDFGEKKCFLVPKLESFSVTQDEDDRTHVEVDMFWANRLLYLGNTKVGYVINRYDAESQEWVEEERIDTYLALDPDNRKHDIRDITWLKAGSHTITPFVKLPILNDTIYISEREKSFHIEPVITLEEESYTISAGKVDGDTIWIDIPFTTNSRYLSVYGGNAVLDWTPGEGGVIHAAFDPNPYYMYLQHYITIGCEGINKYIVIDQLPNLNFNTFVYNYWLEGTLTETYSYWNCHSPQKTERNVEPLIRLEGDVPCKLSLGKDDILTIQFDGRSMYYDNKISGTIYYDTRTGGYHGNIDYEESYSRSGIGSSFKHNENYSVIVEEQRGDDWKFNVTSFRYNFSESGRSVREEYDNNGQLHTCSQGSEKTKVFVRDPEGQVGGYFSLY